MSSSEGSTPIDPAEDAEQATARRRGKTAAEQRQEAATTSDDPEVLTAEIERTREELAETLDAIADKVSPKRVADRTKKKVGDAVKEGAEGAKETVLAGAAAIKGAASDATGHGDDAAVDTAAPAATGSTTALGGTAPTYPPSAPPLHPVPAGASSGLGAPAVAGAVAAVLVALLVLRRRRR